MPFRRSLHAGLAAAAWLAAGAAPAQSGADTFDLSIAGVYLGTVVLSAEQSEAEYAATTTIAPSALVGAVTGYAFDGRARGRIDGSGRVTPVRFEADSRSPRASRRTEIEWEGDTPVRVSVVPPRNSAPDPAQVIGALDPVSAGFALLRETTPDAICDVDVEVYDGSRRSRLAVDAPVAAAGGYTCAGTYARLEGEAHSLSSQTAYPFTLLFAPSGEGRVRVERIETRTRFGTAVVSRRS